MTAIKRRFTPDVQWFPYDTRQAQEISRRHNKHPHLNKTDETAKTAPPATQNQPPTRPSGRGRNTRHGAGEDTTTNGRPDKATQRNPKRGTSGGNEAEGHKTPPQRGRHEDETQRTAARKRHNNRAAAERERQQQTTGRHTRKTRQTNTTTTPDEDGDPQTRNGSHDKPGNPKRPAAGTEAAEETNDTTNTPKQDAKKKRHPRKTARATDGARRNKQKQGGDARLDRFSPCFLRSLRRYNGSPVRASYVDPFLTAQAGICPRKRNNATLRLS